MSPANTGRPRPAASGIGIGLMEWRRGRARPPAPA